MVRKVIFGLKPNSCDVTSQSVSAGCLSLSTPLISLTSRNQKFIQGTQSNLTLSAKPRSSNACWISAIIFPAKSVGKVTLKSIPILNSEPDLSFDRPLYRADSKPLVEVYLTTWLSESLFPQCLGQLSQKFLLFLQIRPVILWPELVQVWFCPLLPPSGPLLYPWWSGSFEKFDKVFVILRNDSRTAIKGWWR